MKGINIAFSVLFFLLFAGAALADDITNAVFEGYVFHGTTLRPLPNARVELKSVWLDGFASTDYIANSDGFYSVALYPYPNVTSYLEVSCLTSKRKLVKKSYMLSTPLRTEYLNQRNFYLAVPKDVSKCVQQ